MKKILATTIGLTAFVAFAFQTPATNASNPSMLLEEEPLVITLDGIEDGQALIESDDFLSEIE